MPHMSSLHSFRAFRSARHSLICYVFSGLLLTVSVFHAALAQSGGTAGDPSACTLSNHVYTCNSATLLKALSSANSIGLQTHNSDGIARSALADLVQKKLHKAIASDGQPADLVFLLMPADDAGQVENNSTVQDLGSLRIYSTTSSGAPAHLLWAETYSGEHDLPWPIVARSVVRRFEKRFQIK